jgi:alkylation response protein AidB-like acyl-CoA dehydrogenase
MEFSLTDEQKMFYDQVLKFSTNELDMGYEEYYDHENNQKWPAHLWKKLGDFGLLGLPFPEQYGGAGAGALMYNLAGEAAARGGLASGVSLAWGAHTILCGIPIWKLGTEEQKQKYLPGICTGEKIGAFGLTEPGSGSDAAAMATTAVKKGDRYILNGTKMFITNGPIMEQAVIFAVTNKEARQFGITAFIVEKDFPGFSVGKELDKMCMRTSTTSELIFEDCEVPEENMLGHENMGFLEVGKLTLGWERGCLIAQSVGGLEHILKNMCTYALQREQFGRPIAKFEAMQEKIARVRQLAEVCRQLVRRVAWLLDNDRECMVEAAVAKLYVGDALVEAADHCVQLYGGYGLMREYMVERYYRDAKLSTIGAGSTEIQKGLIARALMNF